MTARVPTHSGQVGVFVVDDHSPFIDAANDVVSATPGFELVGSATSGREAGGRMHDDRDIIDLVLMDIDLGEESGLDLTENITHDDRPPIVFLVSTMHPDDVSGLVQECGAAAYIPKHELGPAELTRHWEAVAAGHPARCQPSSARPTSDPATPTNPDRSGRAR